MKRKLVCKLLPQTGKEKLPVFNATYKGKPFFVAMCLGDKDRAYNEMGTETFKLLQRAQQMYSNSQVMYVKVVHDPDKAHEDVTTTVDHIRRHVAIMFSCADNETLEAVFKALGLYDDDDWLKA
jgi:hypothetical protein